jgi:signal transduction histidine kinase
MALRNEREERRLLTYVYAGCLLLLTLAWYFTYSDLLRFHDATEQVRRYSAQKIPLIRIMADLRDQEIDVRGHLLTGEAHFLKKYHAAGSDYASVVRNLPPLDPEDRPLLDSLLTLAGNMNGYWQLLLGSAADGSLTSDERALLMEDQRSMEQALAIHGRLIERINTKRAEYLTTENGFQAPQLILIFFAAAIVITGLLFWRLSRSLMRNENAMIALGDKVADLDREIILRRQLQDTLEKLLDSSPNGIMSFRAIRDHAGQVIDFEWISSNRKANEMVGRNDLVGRRLLMEMPENGTSGLFHMYREVVENGDPLSREFHYKGEGLDNWFRNIAVKLEDGFMVTFADITEEKQAQETTLESARIALTGQIMRTIAHELRNPLTNVHLAVDQLKEGSQEQDDLYFQMISRNLERIGTLIREMLESTRRRELDLAPCTIHEVMDQVRMAVYDRVALKGMRIETDASPDLPALLVDKALLILAITNLAVNAIEAMQEGTGVLSIKAFLQHNELRLEVADNGKGMSEEEIKNIFQPFYSNRPGGLGLGLTTTRAILNEHGIKLDVESQIGVGTKFALRMPTKLITRQENADALVN